MKIITVKGVDSILSDKLKQAAKEAGRSVNQVVIDTMKQLPTNDIWIAYVARQHGLKLFSKDQHFKYISGLMLIL